MRGTDVFLKVYCLFDAYSYIRVLLRPCLINCSKIVKLMKKSRLTFGGKSRLLKVVALSVVTLFSPTVALLYAVNNVVTIQNEMQQSKNRIVSGTVQDSNGEPIIGASVSVIGSTKGQITDVNGKFSLSVSSGDVLQITSVGYTSQKVKVGEKRNVVVVLIEDNKLLNEVVVVGYGKMKKGDLSAAVATVANMDKLQERPVSNVSQMLQGQIPGVSVVSNGGHFSSEPTITIRGMGSPNGESPLYVVDGVPGAPFNLSDVTSITVLKDAASAAIYGAYAGSAGVILVTTKQAAPGRTTVEYNGLFGASKATNLPQSLTWEQEYKVRKASYADAGSSLPIGWDRISEDPVYGKTNTDWIGEIFRTAPFYRHNIAISGGTDEISNRLSLEYNDTQGTLINTYSKKIIARLNSMWKLSKYVRIREDLSWRDTQVRDVNTTSAESGVILAALMMPRNVFVYNADGSYSGTVPTSADYITKYGQTYADIHGDCINPVRILDAAYDNNHLSTMTSSTFLDIMEPIKGLNFTSRFTYKQSNYFERYYSTRRLEAGKPNDNNSLEYISYREPEWNWENTLTYNRVFGAHNIGLMASTTAEEYQYRNFSVTGHDFASEIPSMMYFAQAGYFDNATDAYYKDRNFSMVGRASYSYADRYFFTASLRRDYAGRLPQGHKYGDFPSVTAAWKITSEPWMPKSKQLNLLKLRASWGKIGNLGSISYGYGNPTLSTRIIGGGDVGNQIGISTPIMNGIYLANGYNANLTWETSEQVDFGLDASLFGNRMSVTLDYFDKNTKGLIKQQDTNWPTTIGISAQYINDGKVNNRGLELSINWADKINKDWSYYIGGNIATLRNRVSYIGAADAQGNKPVWTSGGTYKEMNPYRTIEGKPLYSFYLIRTAGVFKTDAEASSYVNKDGKMIQPNAKAGDLKFVDKDGDGSIGSGDYEFRGNAMPKLSYAFNAGFTWKKFSFDMMLQGVAGVKLYNAYKYTTLNESLGNFNRSNKILKALDGPNSEVPRITMSDPNGNFSTISDYYLENGSYLRIKNVSISYSFTDLLRKLRYFNDRRGSFDMTLSCDNLLTITPYSGIDPEVGGTGLDCGQYPISRTVSVALKLKF